MSWGWRNKPRSVIKTVQWFKYFSNLENENWDYTANKLAANNIKIHPIRRKYYFDAQLEEEDSPINGLSYEDYLNGTKDGKADSESNARNDLATYKFYGFGYIDNEGLIRVTKAGKLISEGKFDSELFLKQLLKMNFPSVCTNYGRDIKDGNRVFPLQIIIKLLLDLEYLNGYELAYIFLCNDISQYDSLANSIKKFRADYNALDNKMKSSECEEIFNEYAKEYFDYVKEPNKGDPLSYIDSIMRALDFTRLFDIFGRGLYKKVRIAEHSKKKAELINSKYSFITINNDNLDAYMEWYGNPYNIILPWENKDDRKSLLVDKINLLDKTIHIVNEKYELEIELDSAELYSKVNSMDSSTELKLFEEELITKLTTLNEEIFIKYTSKNEDTRKEITDRFDSIKSRESEDMAALWLECNTWKSLVAIDGNQNVVRNFDVEEDLTPKSFAPGKNNTPDMELYYNDTILIPEVSLMSGVQQWEHEGSSVIDHVMKFIDQDAGKEVYGLFISNSINKRTDWQFFLLNKESWMGNPVPVIPLTIEQYSDIISFIYAKNIHIKYFVELIRDIHKNTLSLDSYKQWNECINNTIIHWKEEYV